MDNGSTVLSVVLLDDGAEYQEERHQADYIDHWASLIRVFGEQESSSIQSFNQECTGEGEKKRIARIAPEPQKEQARNYGRTCDYPQKKSLHHRSLTFPDQSENQKRHRDGRRAEPVYIQVHPRYDRQVEKDQQVRDRQANETESTPQQEFLTYLNVPA